jgi:cytochrome c-type biogenesis protein CcmH/NrfF
MPERRRAARTCYPLGVNLAEPDRMRILWWIPVAAAVIGAGAWLRARRKRRDEGAILAAPPVSEQWLAEARGKEEHSL